MYRTDQQHRSAWSMIWLVMIVLAVPPTGSMLAQPDQITANPNAVALRPIWGQEGGNRDISIGLAGGSVGDINHDGIGDFTTFIWDSAAWMVYYGGFPAPDSVAEWRLRLGDSATVSPHYTVTGDFWGSGRPAVAFPTWTRSSLSLYASTLHIFRTDSGRLGDSADLVLDPYHSLPSHPVTANPQLVAGDLDGDGADELIVMMYDYDIDAEKTFNRPMILIYRGGKDFQVDTPSVVIIDSVQSDGYVIGIADIDGDGDLDMLGNGSRHIPPDHTLTLHVWLGDASSPWDWKKPDYVKPMPNTYDGAFADFSLLDADGDGVADLLRTIPSGAGSGAMMFLSSRGLLYDRPSLAMDAADVRWQGLQLLSQSAGYINDSSRRYATTALLLPGKVILMAGGPNGPDQSYEAIHSDTDNMFLVPGPIGDINGDGWEDFMARNPFYGSASSSSRLGKVVIFAGGPYIPQAASLGVREIAIDMHAAAITIWPNPVSDELHIAWRGDLRRMPRRFEVHDLLGREMARGEVESWRGEAVWCTEGAAPGVYVLGIWDDAGELIGTTRVVKP